MKNLSFLLIVFFLLLQFGCGLTNREVIEKYKPEYQKKRQQLKRIAALLSPGAINDAPTCSQLNPPIILTGRIDKSNTGSLTFEQLLNPDKKPKLNLPLGNNFLHTLNWTGPENPLAVLDDNGDELERELKHALTYSYLIVNRTAEYVEPQVFTRAKYTPGYAKVETFIVNLHDEQIICGFVTSAESMPSLKNVELEDNRIYVKKGGTTKPVAVHTPPVIEQLQSAAYYSLVGSFESKIITNLRELSGATVEIY